VGCTNTIPLQIAPFECAIEFVHPHGLIAFLRRRCEQTVPTSWLDEPPADPDIGVREPRRPRPNGDAGTVLLEPLL